MSNNDLISRTAAIDELKKMVEYHSVHDVFRGELLYYTSTKTMLECLSAVDAAPVVHGRWIKMTGMMPPEYHGHYQCSKCAWHMKGLRNSWTREEEFAYCPNCGAKMDE